jgi:hypothetical protein
MRKLFAKRTFAFLLALCAFSLSAAAQVTTTTVASGTNPSVLGASVAFTASVTPNTATGTVSFYDGSTLIGSAAVNAGAAVFTTAVLSPASHNVSAVYNGDASFNPSTSSTLTQTVNVRPTTLVMGALAPVLYGGSRNVSITVTDAGPAAQTCPAPPPAQNTLNTGRSGHTSTLLLSGQVLVVGGQNSGGTALASAELYDPATCSFTNLAAALSTARAGHTATRLSDGRVLIVGGTSTGAPAGALADAEIFDPATGAFTQLAGANQHLSVARS